MNTETLEALNKLLQYIAYEIASKDANDLYHSFKLVDKWYKGFTGTETLNPAAVALGSMTSEKKAAAVRENGKLGGRPRADIEPLIAKAKEAIKNREHVNALFLVKALNITYGKASAIIDALEEAGMVAPAERGKQRKVLMS